MTQLPIKNFAPFKSGTKWPQIHLFTFTKLKFQFLKQLLDGVKLLFYLQLFIKNHDGENDYDCESHHIKDHLVEQHSPYWSHILIIVPKEKKD